MAVQPIPNMSDTPSSPASKPRRIGRPALRDQAPGPDTRTLLLQAATAEFVEFGFANTDTNRIARRANFAPQTFYRWYKDKLDVFIQVYRAWEEAEIEMLDAMLTEQATSLQIAEAFVESYRSFLVFRRNLRQLACESADIRKAVADSRRRQIEQIKRWNPAFTSDEHIATLIVQMDRVCEALAEGEFEELGLSGSGAYEVLSGSIDQLRRPTAAQA
ncbi:MAG: TetR/AcrR family transcriptional regulator [Rubrivivax sp.]|nr:MAG: TetR/AcrR family transcriptional regulator [Rubrivivax sp.]